MIYLSDHEVFAKYSLKANSLVTGSNTSALEQINKDLPAGFVVASLSASAENAVAGKIRTRDYVDVYAIGAETGGGAIAKLVMHHMLVLDVTVSPSTITEAAGDAQAGNLSPGPESAAARGGIPALYTVGVTAEDAGKLALLRDKNVYLTLSANDGGTVPLNVRTKVTDMFDTNEVGDSGAGTAEAVKASIDGTAVKTAVKTATPTATR